MAPQTSSLERQRIRCKLDSEIPLGKDFHHEIRRSIQDCDALIVAMTERSASSAWVNQEIGFGLALGRPVCLIDLDFSHRTVDPAMAATLNICSFEDWSTPEKNFREFADRIKKRVLEGDNSERRDSNLRQVIDGQVPRTNFLIGRLADYLRFDAELDIFIQAAFSSFSISNDPIYSESNDPEYVRLLQIERDHLEELLKKNAVKLKLMVWPFRDSASDPRYLPKGLRTLLNWMKENTLNPKVRFVCGPIRGPNRMVFSSRPTDASGFFIDGYKHEFTAGHHLSIVNYQRSAIEAAVREFSDLFAELALRQRDNQQAVQTLLEETRRKFPGLATKSEFAAGV